MLVRTSRAEFALAFFLAVLGAASATAEPVKVRTATVRAMFISEPLVFNGHVQALRQAVASNRIDGVISAIHFSVGQIVKAGDVLFELESDSEQIAVLAARATLDRAQAELRQKRFILDQQDQLKKKGVASDLSYEEAINDAAIARAGVTAAEAALKDAELQLSRTKVTAPISGWISDPLVALGSFVEAESGKPLAKIVQLDPIQVVYEVPYEQRLETLSRAGLQSVKALLNRITVQLKLPGGEQYPLSARPAFSSAEINPATGTLEVSATFPNPKLVLVPGLPVQVITHVEGVQQKLSAIPREAARKDAHGLYVLVVQPSGLVERRPISLFRALDGRLLVGGVFEGEVVVTDSTFQVGAGAVVTANGTGVQ